MLATLQKMQMTSDQVLVHNILSCTACGGINLAFREQSDNINGLIICQTCGHSYDVRSGIIDALVRNQVIESERKGNLKLSIEDRGQADDAWLLGLPDTFSKLEQRLASQSAYDALADFERLVKLLALPPSALVVDLGAGCCWTSWRLAQRGWRTVATDVSEEKYVGLASGDVYMKHHDVYFHRILFDMSALWPIRDSSVDSIIAFCSIHHATNLSRTFCEAARVLKPGARFAFVEASRWILPVISHNFGEYEREHYGWNEHLHTVLTYAKMVHQANMSFRILPAPSTLEKIKMLTRDDERVRSFNSVKWRLARRFSFLWALPLVRRLVDGPAYSLFCAALGLQFIGLCIKPTSGSTSRKESGPES